MVRREGERSERPGSVEVRGVPCDPILTEGVDLVPRAIVSRRVSVAGTAGLHTVAAHLHVPEQGLAQASRFQAGFLLTLIEVCLTDPVISVSGWVSVEPVVVVLVRKLQVCTGRVGARRGYGCHRVPY